MSSTCEVFISFKNTDAHGAPSAESAIAQELFNQLERQRLKVFFSNVSLEQMGASDFRRAIDDALDAAKILIVVGTTHENINSEWVRYEWSSFHNDILSGVKPDGKLFVYVKDIPFQDLPRLLRQAQVFSHQPNAMASLCNFVENALGGQGRMSDPVSVPPKGHIPRLAVCGRCGVQFDKDYPGECSHQPMEPTVIGNVGPRGDYEDVYKFPCCGSVVIGAVKNGCDVPPTKAPGCVFGRHTIAP